MIICCVVILAFIAYLVLVITDKIREKKFLTFCREHKAELLSGQHCEFEGLEYSADTVLVRYGVCISVIVMTYVSHTCFYHEQRQGVISAICNIITFICGWWGIPWGPIRLIQTLYRNFQQENTHATMAELLYSL